MSAELSRIVEYRRQQKAEKYDNDVQAKLTNQVYGIISNSYIIVGMFLLLLYVGMMTLPRTNTATVDPNKLIADTSAVATVAAEVIKHKLYK